MSFLALDRLALKCAYELQAQQPRADSTIDQLPLAVPLNTDEMVLFRTTSSGGGQMYKALISGIKALGANSLSVYNALTLGVTGNGATDDTAALKAVIASAAITGGIVWMGWGSFVISSTITIPSAVEIWGSGTGATVFLPINNIGIAFTTAIGSIGPALRYCSVRHPAGGANSDITFHVEQSTRPVLSYINVDNCNGAIIDIGNDANANGANNSFAFDHVKGTCLSGGSAVLMHRGGSGWFGDNCVFTGSWNSGSSGVVPATTSYGLASVTTFTLDTGQLTNCNFSGFSNNFYFGPGSVTTDFFIANCVMDYSYLDAFYVNPTGGGTFGNNSFVNCWWKSTFGSDLVLNGGIADGVVDNNTWSECLFPNAGFFSVSLLGSRLRYNFFENCRMTNPGVQGQTLPAPPAAVYVGPNAGSDSSPGPTVFDSCFGLASASSVYGVYLSAGANGLTFKDCTSLYSFPNPFFFADGINLAATRRISVKNCNGFGGNNTSTFGPIVAGATTNYGTLVSPPFVATGANLINPFPCDATLYISGGSGVTGISTGNTVGASTASTGLTSGTFVVPYNCVIKAFWTTTPPTILWYLN